MILNLDLELRKNSTDVQLKLQADIKSGTMDLNQCQEVMLSILTAIPNLNWIQFGHMVDMLQSYLLSQKMSGTVSAVMQARSLKDMEQSTQGFSWSTNLQISSSTEDLEISFNESPVMDESGTVVLSRGLSDLAKSLWKS